MWLSLERQIFKVRTSIISFIDRPGEKQKVLISLKANFAARYSRNVGK